MGLLLNIQCVVLEMFSLRVKWAEQDHVHDHGAFISINSHLTI